MDFVFSPADILLPQTDMEKWAAIACDQYTSEPEYWESALKIAGDAPSALNLVLPEVYLKDDNGDAVNKINSCMEAYINNGLFKKYENSLIYLERKQSDGKIRRGIIGKIDLEQYDYTGKKAAAVRSTEKTVVSRIPPRIKIRENAPLELPHVMLLIDDAEKTVIEPIAELADSFKVLYDFELMLGGGHVTGRLLDDKATKQVVDALKELSNKNNGFLFSVGDGNHSLATAKECYNKDKNGYNRYALVEFVNIHDNALQFEPIYRIVFGADKEKLINSFVDYCGGEYNGADAQYFDIYFKDGEKSVSLKPAFKLAVGTLQAFLDDFVKKNSSVTVDYIHGVSSLKKLSQKDNAVGFVFNGMEKGELFQSVAQDGSLPRKTFSMGHANDKRFYIEARRIK